MSNWLNDAEVLEGHGSGEGSSWSPRHRRVPVGSPRPGRGSAGSPRPGRGPAGSPRLGRVPAGSPRLGTVPAGSPRLGTVPAGSPGPGIGLGPMTSPSTKDTTLGSPQAETMDKARELFVLCDKEGKGFITKRDMQRLEDELPLSPEQLEAVFESLDRESNGFLTPVEFNSGLGEMMGLDESSEQSPGGAEEHEDPGGWSQDPSTARFLTLLTELGSDKLLKDPWEVCSLWCGLQRDRPEFVKVLEDVLVHAVSNLQDSFKERDTLEQALRRRESEHDRVVRSIYEEMESQLREEREKQQAEDSVKQRERAQQLQDELKTREQELESSLANQRTLETRIRLLSCEHLDVKEQNQKLQSFTLQLQEQLESSQAELCDARDKLNLIHFDAEQEQTNRQRNVLKVSRNIQKEKDSLLRQLELLRDMNKRLRDEKDAHQSQKRNPSISKTLQKKGSLIGNYILQDKPIERQLSTSSQPEQQPEAASNQPKRHLPAGGFSGKTGAQAKIQSRVVNPQRVFKVVFLGNSGVGKTSFIHHYCTGRFSNTMCSTVGIDYQMKNITLGSTSVVLQLWDTAGQERFRSITQQYYRKADGILVLYDVTSSSSFTGVREWMDCVQERKADGAVLMLLGNKVDAPDTRGREVTTGAGQSLAQQHEAVFYECSAKTGYNMEELMLELAGMLASQEDRQCLDTLLLTDDSARRSCCK